MFLAICPKKKSLIMFDYQGIFLITLLIFSDPPGARTQDPNIKSVVLYLLS